MVNSRLYNSILLLTETQGTRDGIDYALDNFATELDWHPSDRLDLPDLRQFANAHLIVEHGLQHTAVVSFTNHRFIDLDFSTKRRLLGASYNNLIDWHVCVTRSEVAFVYNRSDPWHVASEPLELNRLDILRRQSFERISADHPPANVTALDDALIRTVSEWRKNLSASLDNQVSYEALSALFNAVLLVRASEDHLRKFGVAENGPATKRLIDYWDTAGTRQTISSILPEYLKTVVSPHIPDYLLPEERLREFDRLDPAVGRAFLADFYRNRFAPYEYDFSLISKHALSRIYEHYVSLLRLENSAQQSLFPEVPIEDRDKAFGSVFTPQFIARFFARFARRERPEAVYPSLRVLDPACGSGIFLRSFLELDLVPTIPPRPTEEVTSAFSNIDAIDRDANACAATRLSLALLHLVATDRFPSSLAVDQADALALLEHRPDMQGAFDIVFANPPFVSLDTQTPAIRSALLTFFGDESIGRADLYLAFVQIGFEALRPGGIGLFVLPRSFLIGNAAKPLRKLLSEQATILCLADLSAIPVFEGVGSYVVLVMFEKNGDKHFLSRRATILHCRAQVGRALQEVLEGRSANTPDYTIFDVGQEVFDSSAWVPLPPNEARIKTQLSRLPKLSAFLVIRQGIISGNDRVFFLQKSAVPKGEEEIWAPLLRDRDMSAYVTPKRTSWFAFYPYKDGAKLSMSELSKGYKKTWAYLQSNERELASRKSLARYKKEWWEPMWTRSPETFFRPKLVTPHLVVVPRFGLDLAGRYTVSHSPVLFPRQGGAERDLLLFFAGILNSSVAYWHLNAHSHKYDRGYVMIENATLASLPVPDPQTVDGSQMRLLINAVERRISVPSEESLEVEMEIDEMAVALYGVRPPRVELDRVL